MRRWIWLAVLVFVVVIPAFLVLRKRRMASELDAWLAERGFVPATCPETLPFGHRDMAEVRCWSGRLADGTPAKVLLGARWKSETVNVPRGSGIAQDSFVAVEVPARDEGWLAVWRGRLGYGGDDPVRAERIGDTMVVVWRGLHDRAVVEARLEAVRRSL